MSMSYLLVFGASTSSRSINQKLAVYTASQLTHQIEAIDLNDFEMPIFSIDREEQQGIPEQAQRFKRLIQESKGIIISLAEHNGGYSAAFKNILDWTSRMEKSLWNQKPMLLMATSPGGRGGASVLETAVSKFPYMDAKVVAQFSLPAFSKNFDTEQGITDASLRQEWQEQLEAFDKALV